MRERVRECVSVDSMTLSLDRAIISIVTLQLKSDKYKGQAVATLNEIH